MNDNEIIRCPRCGGVHLTGAYSQTNGKKTFAKMFFLGWIGILWSFHDVKKQKTYWRCLDCGNQFEM